MTTTPFDVLRTVIEFVVRFVIATPPRVTVSLTFTRTSADFPFAMTSCTGASDKKPRVSAVRSPALAGS